jgi:uncharacterized protein with HEPN domain
MIPREDSNRLRHMLDAARKALRFAAGSRRERLEADDDPLAEALLFLISLIGEAAGRVGAETRAGLSDIP